MFKQLFLTAILVGATPTRAVEATFTTLGTGAGPRPDAHRAQPANLLRSGSQTILIDCGDGASQQLGKAGVALEGVSTVFISHLHFDHTGGLFAYLSRRFQLRAPGVATIYGPPGIKATVDALVAAMAPGIASARNISARNVVSPSDTVRVIELRDGWAGTIGDIRIRVASNTHYAVHQPGDDATSADTYAFRFDTPGRSLVYTGDTGPSAAVEALAKGADVLFAEIMDSDATLASLKAARPDLDAATLKQVEAHYRREHLSPAEVGKMAAHADVKSLVLTHDAIDATGRSTAMAAISEWYHGPIVFADDLQKF